MIKGGQETRIEIGVSSRISLSNQLKLGTCLTTILDSLGIKIISTISQGAFTSHILSHSTLVFNESKLVLLTCGVNSNAEVFEQLFEAIGVENIEYLGYQERGFLDSECIEKFNGNSKWISKAFPRFAEIELNRQFSRQTIFTSTSGNKSKEPTGNYVLLGQFSDEDGVQKLLRPESLEAILFETAPLSLRNMKWDLHFFSPLGVSINGIGDSHYFALHISPEIHRSFASFESDLPTSSLQNYIDDCLLQVFSPQIVHSGSFSGTNFN